MWRSSSHQKVLSVFALQRTATCSAMYRAASCATFGPFASFAASGSGTGSSPARMRATMSDARRCASSAPMTPCRPTVTRFGPSGPRACACLRCQHTCPGGGPGRPALEAQPVDRGHPKRHEPRRRDLEAFIPHR